MEAAVAHAKVVLAVCDHSKPAQRWTLDPYAMQLHLAGRKQCLQIPNMPNHNGKPDGHRSDSGLPSGEELPTNIVAGWENQTTILEADEVDNATFTNESPPFNRGNGAPIDYYGGVVYPQPRSTSSGWDAETAAGERVYWLLPMRFTHYRLPCEGPDGAQCLPATFDVPILASRDGVNFTYVADDRGALVEPATSGGWNANGLTYVLGTPHLTDSGDELVLYFWGTNSNHNGVLDPMAPGNKTQTSIASVRMRLDGWVHVAPLDAAAPAVVVTKPLVYSGEALRLNADAGGSGQIIVTVEEPDDGGKVLLRGKPFSFNDVAGLVQWENKAGGLGGLAGVAVRLRFEIHRAKLYAFQFGKGD